MDVREEIREVLLHDWDPIGVGDVAACRDEYDTQLDSIVSMIELDVISEELLHAYLDDEAYRLFPTWDGDDLLPLAVSKIMAIAQRPMPGR